MSGELIPPAVRLHKIYTFAEVNGTIEIILHRWHAIADVLNQLYTDSAFNIFKPFTLLKLPWNF